MSGLTPPVKDATPDLAITATNQYTAGVVSWSGTRNTDGTFAGNTVYTATVTLSPTSGYTVTGVPQNFFTASGATEVTNPADSGTVTVKFPNTDSVGLNTIGKPTGTLQVGSVLTAGALDPSSASGNVTYRWQRKLPADETYEDILGAAGNTYTLTPADLDRNIRVLATGTGAFAGTVYSEPAVDTVQKGPFTIAAIQDLKFPVSGEEAATAITDTAQYTGTVAWMQWDAQQERWEALPAEWDGFFAGSAQYRAIVTLTPLDAYTLSGVGPNFFTVSGASQVTYNDTYGTITVDFPGTDQIQLTAIGGIRGLGQVGRVLTAGGPEPENSKATYQWQRSKTYDGTYAVIDGATSGTYTLTTGDTGY